MTKLNNTGIAITGILYTLFILFLLILVSVLSGLSSKRNISEHSVQIYEDSFSGTPLTSEQVTDAFTASIAPVTGKYIFNIKDTTIQCVTYLVKGTNWKEQNITYIPKDCNDYDVEMELIEIYNFEKE